MANQFFLDPDNLIIRGKPPAVQLPVPKAIQNLRAIPDAEALRAGDLILVSSIVGDNNRTAAAIRNSQSTAGYNSMDARWHHAAVYLGFDFRICEATRKGVGTASLLDYAAAHLIRVRRDPGLDEETGWKISVLAACQIGTPYSFLSILNLAGRAKKGYWHPWQHSAHVGRGLICSELYSDCYAAASGRTLWNNIAKEVTPAYLSVTGQLSDIDLCWRPLC